MQKRVQKGSFLYWQLCRRNRKASRTKTLGALPPIPPQGHHALDLILQNLFMAARPRLRKSRTEAKAPSCLSAREPLRKTEIQKCPSQDLPARGKRGINILISLYDSHNHPLYYGACGRRLHSGNRYRSRPSSSLDGYTARLHQQEPPPINRRKYLSCLSYQRLLLCQNHAFFTPAPRAYSVAISLFAL